MSERIRLLSLVDIFEPLSEEEIQQLNGQLPDRHLEKGECFYGPDDDSERLFILQKGKVRIFRTSPDGRELTLAVVEAGTVFGEMALTAQQLEGGLRRGDGAFAGIHDGQGGPGAPYPGQARGGPEDNASP